MLSRLRGAVPEKENYFVVARNHLISQTRRLKPPTHGSIHSRLLQLAIDPAVDSQRLSVRQSTSSHDASRLVDLHSDDDFYVRILGY